MLLGIRYVKSVHKRGGRKGDRTLYYWQRPGYRLRRLPDDPDSHAFIRTLIKWNDEADAADSFGGPAEGSFAQLVTIYKASPDYESLAPVTARTYGGILDNLSRRGGHLPLNGIDRTFVYHLRDGMAATPYMANAVIGVLRMVLNFAVDREMIKVNPVIRIKQLRTRPRRQVWSPQAEAAFLAVADATMTLAYKLGAYTAQRQGDLLVMTWSQYDGAVIRLRQHKTDELVEVTCHVDLRAALDAAPRPGLLMLNTPSGRAFTARHFNKCWRDTSRAAGIEGLQFRDLRRTAMVRMAEAGATPIEIAGVSGHSIEKTAAILETYIPRSAAMGRAAILKLESRAPSG